MKKIINSENVQYQPVLTEEWVLDDKATVNSFNGITSDAVARAVAGASGEVPEVTSSDNGKVLKAIYDAGGPAVEWGEVESGATYTAGDGIEIDDQNAVSVKAGNGLSIGNTSASTTVQTVGQTYHYDSGNYDIVYFVQTLTADMLAAIGNNSATVTLGSIPVTDSDVENWSCYSGYTYTGCNIAIAKTKDAISPNTGKMIDSSKIMYLASVELVQSLNTIVRKGVAYNVHASDNTDSDSTLTWSELTAAVSGGTIDEYAICIIARRDVSGTSYPVTVACTHITGVVDGTITTGSMTYTATVANSLNVSNPLPTSAIGDAGKVLTVDNTGAAAWATPSGGDSLPSYTASDLTKVLTVGGNSGSQWLRWDPIWKSMTFTDHSGEYRSSVTYFKTEKTLLELNITGTLPNEIYITTPYKPDPMLGTDASTPVLKTKGGTVCATLQAWANDSNYHYISVYVYDASDDSPVTGLTISAIYQNIT